MNELTVLEKINIIEVFNQDGSSDLLKKIKDEVTDITFDVTTSKGRKEIASMAYKVAKSKTYLDDAGKDLVSDWKAKSKIVDAERKKIREYLDNLKDEVRKPLTEWEEIEKNRIEKHTTNISEIKSSGIYSLDNWMDLQLEAIQDILKEIESKKINDSWEEYANEAAIAKENAMINVKQAIEKRIKYDDEQAELLKLRQEAEERERKDQEEKLRLEGEERAKKEAKEKAEIETKRIEQEMVKAKAKAKEDADRVEKEKNEALQAKVFAEKKAIEAERKAKEDIELAAQRERDRIEQERINEEIAAKNREANKAHKKKINNAALDAFVISGMNKTQAEKAIIAIAKGQIPHITISY